eukprot:5112552-Pleurochrysis_carterae.AAC.1
MHQGTSDVGFIASKDKFPTALRSYLVRNQVNHGCDFAGATSRSYLTSPRSTSCLRTSTCTTPAAASTSRGRTRPSDTCARYGSPYA